MKPDSTECTVVLADLRIRKSVQVEMENICKARMEKEDEITTNKCETLHLQVARLSDEIVGMESGRNGSAASTVSASTDSGGSTSKFAAHMMPKIVVATSAGVTSAERGSRWIRLRVWSVKLKGHDPEG